MLHCKLLVIILNNFYTFGEKTWIVIHYKSYLQILNNWNQDPSSYLDHAGINITLLMFNLQIHIDHLLTPQWYQNLQSSTWFKNPILYIKSHLSMRASVTVSRACVCLWLSVVRAKYRGPETQVLRPRSWEPNAATRQQQKKRIAAPNRTCMAFKIRDDGGCGHCNTRFFG